MTGRRRRPGAAEPRIVRLYRRAIAGAATLNRISKVHIALENRMTPADVHALHAALMQEPSWRSDWRFFATRALAQASRRMPRLFGTMGRRAERAHHRRRWIRKLRAMLDQSRKADVAEPFVRRCCGRLVWLLTAGGDRAGKTLVIGFTGSSARLMLPLPVFLQHLDARRHDLLLVQYPPGRGFFAGIPGLAGEFEAAVARLEAIARPAEYRRAVAIGTSGGALPALMAAAQLGLDIGIAVGSKGPDDPRWLEATGRHAGDILRGHAAAHGHAPECFVVVGADHRRDQAAAHALAQAVHARVLTVSDTREPVGHNPFVPLLRRGELGALLAATIDAPVPGSRPRNADSGASTVAARTTGSTAATPVTAFKTR